MSSITEINYWNGHMQNLSSAKTSGAVLLDAHIMKTNPNLSQYFAFHSDNSCNKQFEETSQIEYKNQIRSIISQMQGTV